MKKILALVPFLLITLNLFGQTIPPKTGSPNTLNGFAGGLSVDTGIFYTPRDTNAWFGRYPEFIKRKTDGDMYVRYRNQYYRIGNKRDVDSIWATVKTNDSLSIKQNGNLFGVPIFIGARDNFPVSIIVANNDVAKFSGLGIQAKGIGNSINTNNSLINFNNTGTEIRRAVDDGNTNLTVNQFGPSTTNTRLQDWKYVDTLKAWIDKTGQMMLKNLPNASSNFDYVVWDKTTNTLKRVDSASVSPGGLYLPLSFEGDQYVNGHGDYSLMMDSIANIDLQAYGPTDRMSGYHNDGSANEMYSLGPDFSTSVVTQEDGFKLEYFNTATGNSALIQSSAGDLTIGGENIEFNGPAVFLNTAKGIPAVAPNEFVTLSQLADSVSGTDLTYGTQSGQIVSSTGTGFRLPSLFMTTKSDLNSHYTGYGLGFFPYFNSAATPNAPTTGAGSGFSLVRNGDSYTGRFDLWIPNAATTTNDIYVRTSIAGPAMGAWTILADRDYVNSRGFITAANLSLGANAGQINNTGGTGVTLLNLGRANISNADTPIIPGLHPYTHTTGSTGYPNATGGGLLFRRTSTTSTSGCFMIDKNNSDDGELYFRLGRGSAGNENTYGPWQRFLSKETADLGYFKQGGNAFGAAGVLGTTDNNGLIFMTNNTNQLTLNASGILYFNTANGGIANSANSNNGLLRFPAAGPIFTRNVADANSALTINNANASNTGFITDFQFNSSSVARIGSNGRFIGTGLQNFTSSNNAFIGLNNTGTIIQRDNADANTILTVNQVNAGATGHIVDFQTTGTNQAFISNTGSFVKGNGSAFYGWSANAAQIQSNQANYTLIVKRNVAGAGLATVWRNASDVALASIDYTGMINTQNAPDITSNYKVLAWNNATGDISSVSTATLSGDFLPKNFEDNQIVAGNGFGLSITGCDDIGLSAAQTSITGDSEKSEVYLGTTGTTISRNSADAVPVLTVRNDNATSTGKLTDWVNTAGESSWFINSAGRMNITDWGIVNKSVSAPGPTTDYQFLVRDPLDGYVKALNPLNTTSVVIPFTRTQTSSLDFPSIAGQGTSAFIDVSVTQALTTDVVVLGLSANAAASPLQFKAYVSAVNTVRVIAFNYTGSAIDLGAEDFIIKVIK